MKEVTRNALLVIFHYGLDHGLQFESYLRLIKKSNGWFVVLYLMSLQFCSKFSVTRFNKEGKPKQLQR